MPAVALLDGLSFDKLVCTIGKIVTFSKVGEFPNHTYIIIFFILLKDVFIIHVFNFFINILIVLIGKASPYKMF